MAINFAVSYTFSPATTISSSEVNTNFSDEANIWTGLEAKTLTLSNLGVDTELKSGGTIKSANGSVTAPGITFTNSAGTGLYRIGADNLGIATAGVIAMSISSGQVVAIKGTATNDAAAAGYVGQYISAFAGSTSAPTTAQYGDLTSISLTAGDWDVSTFAYWFNNGATWTEGKSGISTTTGNSSSGLVEGDNFAVNSFASTSTVQTTFTQTIPIYRVSLTATTTYYMKFTATYSAGTPICTGRIVARRVR